jgi:hypothetical protein
MRVKTGIRVSSLLLASIILAAPLSAAPASGRPVKEPPLLEKIVRTIRASIRTNETLLSIPKP